MSAAYWCPVAWLPTGPVQRVRVVVTGTVISGVEVGVDATATDTVLPGVVLPGLANAHSHAFHRALRGRTHAGRGDFWTWRQEMYRIAGAIDPSTMFEIARAVYAEMVLAGVSAVGEFHYLHHPVQGGRYDDPNAMAEALRAAAQEAGLRLTLLDTCYLTSGIGRAPDGVVRRFADQDVDDWAARVDLLRPDAGFRVGAAVHSVRSVPRDAIATVAQWAQARGAPVHAHLSEQPAENEACLAAYGRTPTQVLDEAGLLGRGSTVVHAIHVDDADVARIGRSGTSTCLCPTTERDLADGLAPAGALSAAGSPLCVGSDQHETVDLLAEARAVEMHERLLSGRRGTFAPDRLVTAVTSAGHRSIGWPEAGVLAVGAPGDLVAVRTDTVRTAGCDPGQVVMVACAPDVHTVVVGGEVVVRSGEHRLGDVAGLLVAAVDRVREGR